MVSHCVKVTQQVRQMRLVCMRDVSLVSRLVSLHLARLSQGSCEETIVRTLNLLDWPYNNLQQCDVLILGRGTNIYTHDVLYPFFYPLYYYRVSYPIPVSITSRKKAGISLIYGHMM